MKILQGPSQGFVKQEKPVLRGHPKRRHIIGFEDQLLLNAGQKYGRMLQREHSAILSTFIKLPFVFNTFVLSIFEWPLKTGLTLIYFRGTNFEGNTSNVIWGTGNIRKQGNK